jgi:CheY-like chemotaxis protein
LLPPTRLIPDRHPEAVPSTTDTAALHLFLESPDMVNPTSAPSVAVVDDNLLFRDMATEWLTCALDNRVMAFEDGVSAWEHLNTSDSADIIISDVNMPGMNGFDLLSRIKKRFPKKICILVSGNPENESTAKSLGADKFLAKPFSMSELTNALSTLYPSDRSQPA